MRRIPVPIAATLALITLAGCGGGAGGDAPAATGPTTPTPPIETATLSGVVRGGSSSTGVLAGATVAISGRSAISDASGKYQIAGIPTGSTSINCMLLGYDTVSTPIVLAAGANTRDCVLNAQEIYRLRPDAVLVPKGSDPIRGVIVVLGGPVASGFVTGDVLAKDQPDAEGSQQALGALLRDLARSQHVALFGRGLTGVPNSDGSDGQILDALATVAQSSGHPELATAPLLLFGISSGGPEAAGFVSRQPERSIGLVERVPDIVSSMPASALGVPAFVMLAALDAETDNGTIKSLYTGNRARGGLWSLAVEPNRAHTGSSSTNNAAAIAWMTEVLTRRLPSKVGDPLIALADSTGWLGDPSTLQISAWSSYAGARNSASWLPSQTAALAWQSLASGR